MGQTVIVIVTAIFTITYAGLILFYRFLFTRLRPLVIDPAPAVTRFSVIIPARNEAGVIAACIHSIYAQQYPRHLLEVTVIDDHSTDDTAAIVQSLQQQYPSLQLIRLADEIKGKLLNAYKKKAIEVAIPQTTGDWIVTTDADCAVGEYWLAAYDHFIQQHQPALVAGPVKFINQHSFVSVFQCLDFLSLQGVTAAAVSAGQHSMCNGANLAYQRAAFFAVNGFKGIDNIASGDDMLLMHKIKQKFPGRLGYLFAPQAVVSTAPMPDWTSFFNQRIRWASKAEKYDDRSITAVLAVVYFYNVVLFVLGLLSLWCSCYLPVFLCSLAVKTITELFFMYPVASFYKEKNLLWWFPLMQPFHIAYIVIAGWLGKFGSYQWKGRQVK